MKKTWTGGILLALGILGCGGTGNVGGYESDDASVDDALPAPTNVARGDAGAHEGGGSCEDPDNRMPQAPRGCETPCHSRGMQSCVDNRWTTCASPEVCGNTLDDNCDGQVDEGCGACSPGAQRACYGGPAGTSTVGPCRSGTQPCGPDREWGACAGDVRPVEEACNGADDDCDGSVDEGLTMPCAGGCGTGMRVCVGGAWSGCNARTPVSEACNGADDDCDGSVDEDFSIGTSCSAGVGACRREGRVECAPGGGARCTAIAGPPSPEACNGVDDDCDGRVDEDVSRACRNACGTGSEFCASGAWGGCTAPPPAPEVCDLRDNNCNGQVDEGLTATYTFRSRCTRSRLFISFGGCNACRNTCVGYWVNAGASLPVELAQNTCYSVSIMADTPRGRACIDHDRDSGAYVGEVSQLCNGDCRPDGDDIYCTGWE